MTKIYISKNFFIKKLKIFDNINYGKIETNQPLQLVFYDGSTTLKVFKSLYSQGKDAFFVVQNLEFFMLKMRLFRNLEFIEISNENLEEIEDKEIKKVFGLGNEIKIEKDLKMKISKYISIEKSFKAINEVENTPYKGIEVSFRPKAFDSVKTSLMKPELYLSEEMPCHVIYRILVEGAKTLQEIKKYTGENIEDTIKSMLFTGIIERKGDKFSLSSLFN